MFETIENLKIDSILHRRSKPTSRVCSRRTHSFFIRTQGEVLYHFPDREILAGEGSLVFFPKGASYTGRVLSDCAVYTAIHFEADFAVTPEPACFSLDGFLEADYVGNQLADLWKFGTPAEKYRCISTVYSLLAYLAGQESAGHIHNAKFRLIEPAVAYLKTHMYDCDLKTQKLHRLCGISGTYFRQIFQARFGTTPQNYITARRVSHARAILSSGDFNTIGEVAQSAGFNDALYFSKVFKKAYGVTPSEFSNA